MTVDELLQQRRICRQDDAPADVRAALERATKDLASAEHMQSVDHGWAFSIAYNAVLHAARAVMFSHGFRPASHESHKNTFAFLRASAEGERRTWVDYFDRMRVKRHEAVYETAERISRTEAEALIDQARGFIAWAKEVALEEADGSPG
jgi:uncharacterized protein (UPF0332 family)